MQIIPMTTVTLPIDPAALSTAQQKKVSFKSRRIFTNPRVAAGMKAVRLLALPHRAAVCSEVPHGSPVRVEADFLYAYPKGTPAAHRIDRAPLPHGADLDNRFKAVGDALTKAGWWEDDRAITTLVLRKMRTTSSPRIILRVSADTAVEIC